VLYIIVITYVYNIRRIFYYVIYISVCRSNCLREGGAINVGGNGLGIKIPKLKFLIKFFHFVDVFIVLC